MAADFMEQIKELFGMSPKEVTPEDKAQQIAEDLSDSSSSVSRALLGSVTVLTDYYLPTELIGGCCPRIPGEEEGIVWNAAAEAADTERVHVAWQAKGDKIWYLACRSSELSSHPGTWCPFAALLPGMKDAVDPPAIYTYFSDESATMMTVLSDGLQIHRGTTSVIRAKAERTSRELGGAIIIELIPDRIEKLVPVPWYSLSLFEERARRILATLSIFSAIVFAGLFVIVWLAGAMSTVSAHADLKEIRDRSEKKSLQLMKLVQAQRASPMREELARFSEVNDGLLSLNGYLEIYEVEKGKAQWRAVIPANVTSDRIKELGGMTLDATDRGVVIGSSKEAIDLGKNKKKRRRR